MATTTATATETTGRTERSTPPLLARLKEAGALTEMRPAIIGAGICLGLLMVIFRSNLRQFLHVWWTDQNYSHGFLVPLISLYFANLAAERGPTRYVPAERWAVVMLLVAMLGRLATIVVPVGIVGDLSFLIGLTGIVTLFAGRQALGRYGFALFFLVFMVPLPIHLYTTIATPLQLMVSQVAAAVLNASGLPVLCEGNHLTLPGDVKMFVAEACSGMRQLTGFLALTTAVAYLAPRPLWFRGVLIASSIPIALTANIARVVLTGWIMSSNPELAQGTFHTLEGLLMMGFGLALLRLECAALNALMNSTAVAAPASPVVVEVSR